jgi:hypothetical protein
MKTLGITREPSYSSCTWVVGLILCSHDLAPYYNAKATDHDQSWGAKGGGGRGGSGGGVHRVLIRRMRRGGGSGQYGPGGSLPFAVSF